MSYQDFAAWLAGEVQAGRMAEWQMLDLLAQRSLFDDNRAWIEQEFRSRVAGFVDGRQLVADSVAAILDEAARVIPGRMLYFEPIGYRLF